MNDNGRDNFTIEIDDVLRPIVPDFIKSRNDDCMLIRQLLNEENYAEIRLLGHRMKGTGGSYGFDAISEIGEMIETAALAADRETIRGQLQLLEDYLKQVSVVYV
ncbi:MAG: Hpt domain-containing protein [Deltaproteobacteria bacterium]|nr:Hpt domain-containing protein [Deltaproteobacteria bacterium]